MGTDFRDAAGRHRDDAEHLLADHRFPNADHLFGVSAECSLKAVMLALGMTVRADGAPTARQHRVHINDLWNEFGAFVGTRTGTTYQATISAVTNPFTDWDVGQRYAHRAGIAEPRVQAHKAGAETAWGVLQQAILDGVVS